MEFSKEKREQIKQRIRRIIGEQLGVSVDILTPETCFTDDLGADSLDSVEIIMELEEEFDEKDSDFSISDEESEKLKTVGEVEEFIIKKLEGDSSEK